MKDIDKINNRILRELKKDGRISNSELANRVGLSASACLRRVQELERSNVISGYKAVINPERVGIGCIAYVGVGLNNHSKDAQSAFEFAMSLANEVRECHNVTGAYEYLLRVETSNLSRYREFHRDVLGVVPQVTSITTFMVMESSKDERA